MNDSVEPPPSLNLRSRRRYPSIVWAVPAIALLIGLWLVIQTAANKGPTITISFKSAEGLEAGKTKVRYKNVDVGDVKTIALSADRKEVLVTALLSKDASDLLVSDSRFFVVKPRISGGSVSGLSTLLTGAYIGIDVGVKKNDSRQFVGLEEPPLITNDSSGREFVLNGEQIGSVDFGSPVFFRHIKVGHVTRYTLNPDGKGVTVRLFVDAPYDRFVTADTRFWHASGVDMSFDANGFKVTTESVVSILEGGLAFQERSDSPSIGEPSPQGSVFTLFADRDQAMRRPDNEVRTYLMYFSESLRGLSPGAPVDMRGIVIGEVKSLGVQFDRRAQMPKFPVEINIYPNRLRSRYRVGSTPPPIDGARERQFLDGLIAGGMRGQLRTGNLLTGQLYIALDFFSDAPKAALDWAATPPVMPTVGGGLTEIQDTIGRIVKKVDRIPLDKLSTELVEALSSLNKTLASTEQLMKHVDTEVTPEAVAALREAREALASAKAILSSESPVQQDVHDALKQVSKSARSLTTLTDYLERHPESLIFGKKDGGK